MCQDKKDQPHRCCGKCRTDFDKSAPKQDTPAKPPQKRTCGTPPPPPEKPQSGDGVERPRICTPAKKK